MGPHRTGGMRVSAWHWAMLAIVLDQVTKAIARASLPYCADPMISACPHTSVLGVSFVRVGNDGSALGFGQGRPLWVVIAAAGAVVSLVYARRHRSAMLVAAAALQFGGAVANVVDRIVIGHVTDFIVVGPVVMNVADVALLCGGVLGTSLLARRVAGSMPERAKEVTFE